MSTATPGRWRRNEARESGCDDFARPSPKGLERVDWLVQPAIAFGLSRLLIFAAAILGDVFLPTEPGHWVADPNSPFLSLWAKWDSQWYIQIARDGYWFQPFQMSNVAFFPLYPSHRACAGVVPGWQSDPGRFRAEQPGLLLGS